MTARRTDSESTEGSVWALRSRSAAEEPAFLSIADGQFPAVRIRDRVIVPAKAIEAITAEALDACAATGAAQVGGVR
jgi:hypothetical protein